MFGITPGMLFSFFVRTLVLFTAMPVHECAHGLIADRLGDDTPRSQGRLTLNPFVHLDLAGSILLFLTGFGWAKPVQVDMRNFKHPRRDMALTSLAGPLSNILMALLVLIIYKLLLGFVPVLHISVYMSTLSNVLGMVISINLSLAVFNLLPVPPLDGSKIFGVLLPQKLYWGMLRYQQVISLIVMLLLFTGILSPPINAATSAIFKGLDLITYPINLLFR